MRDASRFVASRCRSDAQTATTNCRATSRPSRGSFRDSLRIERATGGRSTSSRAPVFARRSGRISSRRAVGTRNVATPRERGVSFNASAASASSSSSSSSAPPTTSSENGKQSSAWQKADTNVASRVRDVRRRCCWWLGFSLRDAAPGAADAFFSFELNRSTAAACRSMTVARRLRRAAYRDQGSAPPSAPTQRAASAWTPSRDGSDSGWRANGSKIFAPSVSLDTVIQSAAFANALARRCACRCATFSNTSTSLLFASRNCLSGTKRGTYVDELSSTRTASTDTCARLLESSASASASRTCGTRSSLQISRT